MFFMIYGPLFVFGCFTINNLTQSDGIIVFISVSHKVREHNIIYDQLEREGRRGIRGTFTAFKKSKKYVVIMFLEI